MLKIQKYVCNMFGENTYVVWDDTRECVIIDCGAFYPEEHAAIENLIKSESLKPVHLLCTHGHIDHVMGNGFVSQTYGINPEIHAGDEYLITNLREQARSMVGMDYADYIPPVGKYLSETDVINFGSHTLEIIHTPGHTPGESYSIARKRRWLLPATPFSTCRSEGLISPAVRGCSSWIA